MRDPFVIAFLAVLLAPSSVIAAPPTPVETHMVTVGSAGLILPTGDQLVALAANRDASDPQPAIERPIADTDPRRVVLSSLHAVTGVVQTYDGLLTLRVLKAGGVETNPLLKPVVRHEGALIGVKVAAAVATVLGSETLWRNNHRVGAIVASVVANSAMAMVARHNAGVLRRLEGR